MLRVVVAVVTQVISPLKLPAIRIPVLWILVPGNFTNRISHEAISAFIARTLM